MAQIGNITVPVITPTGTFPTDLGLHVKIDYPVVTTTQPKVAIHQFAATTANLKREQRFYLGDGAREWQINMEVCVADLEALVAFWEDRKGTYQPFTFHLPVADGTFTDVTAMFKNEPLFWDYQPSTRGKVQINLIEVNTNLAPSNQTVSATVLRFPAQEDSLYTALTAQTLTPIPLLHIKVNKVGYPDNIYLSDRQCQIGGQVYQARLLRWENVGQVACGLPNISAESDNVTFVLGNADRVMRMLADDVQLDNATVEFSIYIAEAHTVINFWAGIIVPGGWSSDGSTQFTIQCSDVLSSPFMIAPPRVLDRKCDALFDDGFDCPFTTKSTGLDVAHFPDVVNTFCDHGYATPNGCLALGMKHYFRGVIVDPQAVKIKDNKTGFFGIGRTTITSVSLISDAAYGFPIPIVVTASTLSNPLITFPINCSIIAGRNEGDFYEALGVVCEGPVTFVSSISLNTAIPLDGQYQILDGQLNHGYPAEDGKSGLRTIPGNDPAGDPAWVAGPTALDNEWMSLDQAGDQVNGDFRLVYDGTADNGGSTYADDYSAGVAALVIRIKQSGGFANNVSAVAEHHMSAALALGWKGHKWVGGTRSLLPASSFMTNPVWFAVNLYLYCRKLKTAPSDTQLAYFDVTGCEASADICDLVVDRLVDTVPTSQETQFTCIGAVQDQRPLRDWLVDILANCLGYYTFIFGKLTIGIRENASAAAAFTDGNMLFRSLKLGPLGPKYTRLSCTFSDFENGWVPNSANYQDDDYAKELGGGGRPQHLTSTMNLALTADISQASRIAMTRCREEIGGVTEDERKAARRAQWGTTIVAMDVVPGMVVSITDPEMPTGFGHVRVERYVLNPDWSITLSGATVTASMYDEVFGPKPADVRPDSIPPELFAVPLEQRLHANDEIPIVDNPLYTQDDRSFKLGQEYTDLADPSVQATACMFTKTLITDFIPNTVPPLIVSAKIMPTGGTLMGGHSYFICVCCKNSDDKYTPTSNVIKLFVPAEDDSHTPITAAWIELSKISWPAPPPGGFVGYETFGAPDDERMMCAQDLVGGQPDTVAFGVNPLKFSTFNPPSFTNKFVRAKVKLAKHVGVIGTPISKVESDGLTCLGLSNLSTAPGGVPGTVNPPDTADIAFFPGVGLPEGSTVFLAAPSGSRLFAYKAYVYILTGDAQATYQWRYGPGPTYDALPLALPHIVPPNSFVGPTLDVINDLLPDGYGVSFLLTGVGALGSAGAFYSNLTTAAPSTPPDTSGPDDWAGRTISVIAHFSTGYAGIWDFTCTAYDATTGKFSLTPDPEDAGVQVGDVLVVQYKPDIITSTSIGDSKAKNQVYPSGMTPGVETEFEIITTAGTGRGQLRNIIDNDETTHFIDTPWDVLPDDTTRYMVVAKDWQYQADGTKSTSRINDIEVKIKVVVDNLLKKTIVMAGFIVDSDGNESLVNEAPHRPMYLYGAPAFLVETDKVTWNLDDDIVVDLDANPSGLVDKFGNVHHSGTPFIGSISVTGPPTTADTILDVEYTRDAGVTWSSIFPDGNVNKIIYPLGTPAGILPIAVFNPIELLQYDMLRIISIQSGGATGIDVVIKWGLPSDQVGGPTGASALGSGDVTSLAVL